MRNVFPDIHYGENEIISHGNKVIFVGNVTDTHKGNFFFIPTTGNKISYEAVCIHTIGKDGKIVEHKAIRDDLKFMMQLDAVSQYQNLNLILKDGRGKVIEVYISWNYHMLNSYHIFQKMAVQLKTTEISHLEVYSVSLCFTDEFD